MPDLYTFWMIAFIALVTAALRFFSFMMFRGSRKPPALIDQLGRTLPQAIIGMLVVYCMKSVSLR